MLHRRLRDSGTVAPAGRQRAAEEHALLSGMKRVSGTNRETRLCLPGGEYELQVLHYAQSAPVAPAVVRLRGDETLPAAFSLALMPPAPHISPK